jgi:hypothetical protein
MQKPWKNPIKMKSKLQANSESLEKGGGGGRNKKKRKTSRQNIKKKTKCHLDIF